MQIIENKINLSELKKIAQERFGDMLKAVVDIEKEIMAIGGEMHADEEALLLEKGSKQENLWGINIYPDHINDDLIEFNSMINLRPRQNNRSRGVDNPELRDKIKQIIDKLIIK
ncbi:hypothetical protein KJ840_00285 [Patescibacteria group bacterium]|nr:hypothetical protein [Patescibacteria group bacterium]